MSKNNFETTVDGDCVNKGNNDDNDNRNNNNGDDNNNNNVEESLNVSNSGKTKKSRSTSDAERRRRRQQRILGDAGNRLSKINYTHTSLGGDSSTRTTPLASRRSSPLPSERSSPTREDAPDSPFSRSRRNTGNFEAYSGGGSDNDNSLPTPHIKISEDNTESELYGSVSKRLNSILESEEPSASRENQDNNESYRGNNSLYQGKNSSSTSLASSIGGGSEHQYSPQYQHFSEHENFINQQLEQSSLPFPPFLNPDIKIFSPFGDGGSIDNDINNININAGGGVNHRNGVKSLIKSRSWKLVHFVSMIFLGIYFTHSEFARLKGGWTRFYHLNYEKLDEIPPIYQIPSMPLFWYFVTAELILQSARLLLQREQMFQGSTLGTIAASLPEPFPDIIKILLRYRLIWNSLWEDICILVFIVGFVITISPIFAYFD